MNNLIANQLLEFVFIHVLAFCLGMMVIKYNLKVNYTRKINHFFVFFSPYIIQYIFPFQETLQTQIIVAGVGLATLAIYLKPIRGKIKIVGLMFAAFDRPEDRPHTLKWLFTQYLATYLVAVPLWLLFNKLGFTKAIPVIILINAVGDGLAEPIGIKWGKNKYKVKALFSKQIYNRSLQGSACVFIVSVFSILVYHSSFSQTQLVWALLTVPLTATLAEAKSPHTWDSPFIFLFTGINLLLIFS